MARTDMNKLYDEELVRLMKKLSELEPGSSEYNMVLGDVSRLSMTKNEANKSKAVVSNVRTQKWLKFSSDVLGVVIPSGVYVALELIGLDYEEKGYISSQFLKSFISKLRPNK